MHSLQKSTIADTTKVASNTEGNLTILDIPTEIQLTILSLLDIQSLLAIRQTCSNLCQATHERFLWLSLLEQQRQYSPVPYDILHSEDPYLPNCSASVLESIVRQGQRVADGWARPRNAIPQKIKQKGNYLTLMGLEIFLDRWLLVIYSEGAAACLYDLKPTPAPTADPHDEKNHQAPAVLRSSLDLRMGIWDSYAITFDFMANKLFFGLARSVPPFHVHMYEIDLTELSSNNDMSSDAFKIIRIFTMESNPLIKALNAEARIVALSSLNRVELVKWDEAPIPDPTDRITITLQPEDHEDHLKEIVAGHFMGPYIVIFKTRSLEFRDFTSLMRHGPSEPPAWPTLKYHVQMTFRDVSLSDCSRSRDLTSGTDTYTTSFFAYDVIQGLFQYVIRLTLPFEPSTLPPYLEVNLIGIYPLVVGRMAMHIQITPMMMADPSARRNTSRQEAYFLNLLEQDSGPKRGFISSHVMGPQGMRGMWIERKRSSPIREIQIWRKQPASDDLEIERTVVYAVNADVTLEEIRFCTLSELSGKIVLGSRYGDVTVLDLT